jgi:probable F420-dependent oxidoreductase
MQLGIHLPHAGEQATPDKIRRAAMRAEDLGLDDVWVSEHIIVPRATFPRSPLFYDPVLSLVWAAAVTKRVRLGTSVLVLPMRHPLSLAKELATLQNFSEGRLILGAGVGWLEAEFAALGAPFHERGRRTDEGIAMMRAVWSQDPVTFRAKYIPAEITEMTMQPLPVKPIPIWFGARSEAAYRRTVRIGDGWHGSQLTPEQAAPAINRCAASARNRNSRFRCAPTGTARIRANCASASPPTGRSGSSTSWFTRSTATSTIGTRSSKAPAGLSAGSDPARFVVSGLLLQ